MNTENEYSVVPAEGEKPIPILTDEHFEEMCNPTKYHMAFVGSSVPRRKILPLESISIRDFLMQMGGLPRVWSTCQQHSMLLRVSR